MSRAADALHAVQEASYERAGAAIGNAWPRERAMDADELDAFLGRRLTCVLATTTGAGRAQARPVGFAVHEAAFWCATVAGGRLANLERTPWASLVVFEGDGAGPDAAAHRALAADGPVAISPEPPAGLLERWEARYGTAAPWAVAWLELRPARLYSYRGA